MAHHGNGEVQQDPRTVEHYHEGLGQRLRQVADQIIDADYKEVEADRGQVAAPPLVPLDQTAKSTAREEGPVPTS